MSRFHDELVAARRRGDAPGQAPQPASPSAVPATFSEIPQGVPLVICSRCGSVVTADRTEYHADWHVLIGY